MCVLPVIGKAACVRWTRYQRERPSQRAIDRWLNRDDVTGIAIVCGAVSGGLAVRDYDDADAYHAWAAARPDLAATLPTVRTSRGYHVYCRLAEEVYLSHSALGDGELIGDSVHYVLAPPSRHPDGPVYTWLTPLTDAPLPVLDPVASGLVPPTADRVDGSQTRTTQWHVCTQRIGLSEKWTIGAVREAIRETLPTAAGQRNRALWGLARRLAGLPGLRGAPVEATEAIVREWHERALAVISTRDWEVTWGDWCRAWSRVRHPVGTSLAGVGEMLRQMVPRAEGGDDLGTDLLRLELLCEELDRRHEGRPYPLSVRIAGRLIGTSYAWAARLLRRLERAGVLERVGEADRRTRRAREWRYCGARILRLAGGTEGE